MSEDSKNVLSCLGLIAVTVVSVLLNGLVLVYLWLWFIVPVFHLPELSIPQALGISMLMSALTHQRQKSEKKEEIAELVGYAVGGPLVTLLLGWLISLFL